MASTLAYPDAPQPQSQESCHGVGIIILALLLLVVLPTSSPRVEKKHNHDICQYTQILRCAVHFFVACRRLIPRCAVLCTSLVNYLQALAQQATALSRQSGEPTAATERLSAISHVLCVVISASSGCCETRPFITFRRQLLEYRRPSWLMGSSSTMKGSDSKPAGIITAAAAAAAAAAKNTAPTRQMKPENEISSRRVPTSPSSKPVTTSTAKVSTAPLKLAATAPAPMTIVPVRTASSPRTLAIQPLARTIHPVGMRRRGKARATKAGSRSRRIRQPSYDLDSRIYESFPRLAEEDDDERDDDAEE
ncbi:hypothetical protein B0H63DRAFT_180662 [Podospora didyma]|uniref:Uncharacterized protein n=1 Tax=Podospora didyma TaxID=330526 RepID=A0AAE0TZN1_9PEZI|nr:hypothetical protein B0H63DRAFT_180662 [Podospora didyma]